MFLNTLFALFGDDLRLWLTTKDADIYFEIGFSISLFLFILELLLNSLIRSIYAEPFFFYLDIIATLSLVPDVSWLMWIILILVDRTPIEESKDVILGTVISSSAASGRAQRLIKSIRLIRLIRIIKLYKYAVKSNTEEEEAKLREQK